MAAFGTVTKTVTGQLFQKRGKSYHKIKINILRDFNVINYLKNNGWNVIIIWECELHGQRKDLTLQKLMKELQKAASTD